MNRVPAHQNHKYIVLGTPEDGAQGTGTTVDEFLKSVEYTNQLAALFAPTYPQPFLTAMIDDTVILLVEETFQKAAEAL